MARIASTSLVPVFAISGKLAPSIADEMGRDAKLALPLTRSAWITDEAAIAGIPAEPTGPRLADVLIDGPTESLGEGRLREDDLSPIEALVIEPSDTGTLGETRLALLESQARQLIIVSQEGNEPDQQLEGVPISREREDDTVWVFTVGESSSEGA